MKQIVLKDLRRLRVEIAINLFAIVLLTRVEWHSAAPWRFVTSFAEILPFLIILLWWFIVVRLIQGDSLVGDRQFWVTRPYVWHELLAAKVLFVGVCIAAPLLLSQALLLLLNGHQVVPNLGKAVLDTGGAMLVTVLPVAAFACLTSSFSRWLIFAAAAVLILMGLVWLNSTLANSQVNTGSNLPEIAQGFAFACLTSIGIAIQYAQRHRWAGTIAIAAAVVAVPVIMIATPYRTLLESAYPSAGSDIPFHATFVPNAPTSYRPSRSLAFRETNIALEFPVQLSGIPPAAIIQVDGATLSGRLPNEQKWDSEWRPLYGIRPEEGKALAVRAQLDHLFFDRLRDDLMPIHLSIAVTQLAPQSEQRVLASPSFAVQEVGPCWLDENHGSVQCRSTEKTPSLMSLTASPSESTCAETHLIAPRESVRLIGSKYGFEPLSPLSRYVFPLPRWACPGTPLIFTALAPLRRVRFDLNLGSIRLRDFLPRPYEAKSSVEDR